MNRLQVAGGHQEANLFAFPVINCQKQKPFLIFKQKECSGILHSFFELLAEVTECDQSQQLSHLQIIKSL